MAKQTNGKALTVKKGTKPADILKLAAETLEASRSEGKAYFSKLVVIREDETGKVFLGKAFGDRIGLFTESLKLPIKRETSFGEPEKV